MFITVRLVVFKVHICNFVCLMLGLCLYKPFGLLCSWLDSASNVLWCYMNKSCFNQITICNDVQKFFVFHIGIYMATWPCTLAKQVLRTWFEVSRQQSSKSDVILFLKQDAKFWQVIFDTNAQVKQIGRGGDKNRKREKESQKWKRGWEKKKGGGESMNLNKKEKKKRT